MVGVHGRKIVAAKLSKPHMVQSKLTNGNTGLSKTCAPLREEVRDDFFQFCHS